MKEDKIKTAIDKMKESRAEFEKNRRESIFSNKKRLIVIVAVVLIAALGIGIYKKIQKNKLAKQTQSAPVELADQYRKQLPELKNKANNNTTNDLQNYAVALYATGNLAEAEQVYQKQLGVDNNNSVAHNNLANVLRDEKKFDQASQHYEQALKLSPKYINTYINLGSLYRYSINDMSKAIDTYKRGIETNPESADLNILLGLAYEQSGEKDNAQKSFEKALQLQGESQAAKAGLERLKH